VKGKGKGAGGGGGGGKGKGGKGGGGGKSTVSYSKGNASKGKGKGGKKGYVIYSVSPDGVWTEVQDESWQSNDASVDVGDSAAWHFDDGSTGQTTWTEEHIDAMWMNALNISSVVTESLYLGRESAGVNSSVEQPLLMCSVGKKLYILVDSGASLSACPIGMLRGKSVPSRYQGQKFSTADGGLIDANKGLQALFSVRSIKAGTAKPMSINFQFEECSVNKIILSVHEMVERGHVCILRAERPKIVLADGSVLPLMRSAGSFYLVADQSSTEE